MEAWCSRRKNGKSEEERVNVGSQVEPVPNCATKDETDAEVMVPPSGQTSTMLAAGPTGVLPPPAGGGVRRWSGRGMEPFLRTLSPGTRDGCWAVAAGDGVGGCSAVVR